MLVIFFGWQEVVHKEFVPEGQAVSFEFYREVMDRLMKRLRHLMSYKTQSGSRFLQHNNAPSHNATIDNQFLANKKRYCSLSPSYSSDLAPADYFLFPKVKSNFKGRRFDTILDIHYNVTSELKVHSDG
jgi:hypothetical protein